MLRLWDRYHRYLTRGASTVPQYYVYDRKTGAIVHQHEAYDGPRDESMTCSKEEVLALVDSALEREALEVLEVADDFPIAEVGDIRVDPKTRQLVYERMD